MKHGTSLTAEHIHSFIEYIIDNILDQVFIQTSCHQLFDLSDILQILTLCAVCSDMPFPLVDFFFLVVYCFQLLGYW